MIYAYLANKSEYYGLLPQLDRALDLLTPEFLNSLPPEWKYLDGDNLYAAKFDVETVPFEETFYESHQRYLDIQIMVAGQERIDIAHPDTLKLSRHEGDFYGYEGGDADQSLILKPGRILVLFPGDAHRLKIPVAHPGEKYSRVCMKVKL